IGQLFMAGILPGLLLASLFMGVIIVCSVLNPGVAGQREPLAPWPERRRRLTDLLPPLFVFVLVMGSIYAGLATPTEAAAVGAIGALLLVGFYRQLSIQLLKESMLATVSTTAMTLLIL